MLLLKIDGEFTDPSLPVIVRDPLLMGDNDGVRWLFDLAFPYSYAGNLPAQDALIRDVSGHSNGKFNLSLGQSVGFNGNGFDFSTLVATSSGNDNCNVEAPAGVWSSISEDQYFMVCFYVQLTSEDDWNVDSNLFPIFGGSELGYQVEADPLTIAQSSSTGVKVMSFRRQTGINTQLNTQVNPAAHFGKFTQIAFWRTAAGVSARLKSIDATTITNAAVGAANSLDLAPCRARYGIVPPFTNFSIANHRTAKNFKLYRGFIEDLSLSERDPASVLDADFARVVSRDVFS